MTTYQISDISAASPEMNARVFQELVESIRDQGQLVPIWKSGDEIIDGRKRLRACILLGIEPVVVDVSPSQDTVAVAYSLNILRTHYTTSQRAMFAESRANMTKGDGAARRHADQGESPAYLNLEMQKRSITEAAQEAGVSAGAVNVARAIRRNGAPEVTTAVVAGALTLYSAEQIVKTVPKGAQPAAVVKVVAAAGGGRQTPARVLGKPTENRSPVRPLALRMERGLDQLETAIELLAKFVQEGEVLAEWVKRLSVARTQLGRIIDAARGNR